MEKILTLVIPSYNMEIFLEKCLNSLLVKPERMKMFEVLIINDGSKDQTSAIGHRYQEKYPATFRVIDKTNGHYGSCINRGIDEARGSFIKVLDADDSFDTPVFEQYLDFLSDISLKEEADLILSDFTEVDENQTLLSLHPYDDYANPFTLDQVTGDDSLRWFIHGLAYRTGMLKEMRYRQTEGISYTDIEWSFYPLSQVRKAYRFKGYLYRYTKLRSGQSVEPVVHGKNIWMEAKLTEDIIRSSRQVLDRSRPENKRFISDLITLNIVHIYQLYLLTLNKYVKTYEPLHNIDFLLKKDYPELYEKTRMYRTTILGHTFHPIDDWRRGKHASLMIQHFLYGMAEKKNQFMYSRRVKSNQ